MHIAKHMCIRLYVRLRDINYRPMSFTTCEHNWWTSGVWWQWASQWTSKIDLTINTVPYCLLSLLWLTWEGKCISQASSSGRVNDSGHAWLVRRLSDACSVDDLIGCYWSAHFHRVAHNNGYYNRNQSADQYQQIAYDLWDFALGIANFVWSMEFL